MLDGIKRIYNNDALYGHCLTTLPSTIWNFATSTKLVTYTNLPPGVVGEQFFLIFEKYTIHRIDHPRQYPGVAVPVNEERLNVPLFKYLEIGFRRIVGTCLTAGATITAVPIGLVIKIIQKTFG